MWIDRTGFNPSLVDGGEEFHISDVQLWTEAERDREVGMFLTDEEMEEIAQR